MFDLSFGKLAIIFTLCLVVLGPEKLPKLAAQLGRWTGQARAMARHFREQLEQEIATEELLKQKREIEQKLAANMAAAKSTLEIASAPLNDVTETIDNTISPHLSSPITTTHTTIPVDSVADATRTADTAEAHAAVATPVPVDPTKHQTAG